MHYLVCAFVCLEEGGAHSPFYDVLSKTRDDKFVLHEDIVFSMVGKAKTKCYIDLPRKP